MIVTAMLGAPVSGEAAPPTAAESLVSAPAEFTILSPDTGQVVGHGRYSAIRTADGVDIRGDNRYLDGAYDIEQDRLAISASGETILKEFQHSFFLKGGAPQSAALADVTSGLGSCVYYQGVKHTRDDKKLVFPNDTYAGVTVLLPIEDFLRNRRDDAPLKLHVFNCSPGPRLFSVEVTPRPASVRWVHHPAAPLEQVDVKPDFGFWNFVVMPFIPKLAAWFDPGDRWSIVGAQLQRYYRGPNIIMVRSAPAAAPHSPAVDARNPPVAGSPPP